MAFEIGDYWLAPLAQTSYWVTVGNLDWQGPQFITVKPHKLGQHLRYAGAELNRLYLVYIISMSNHAS